MFKFVLIVLLFNNGDGKVEFAGARLTETAVTCEALYNGLGDTPTGYRAAHQCIPIEKLDTTLVTNEQVD